MVGAHVGTWIKGASAGLRLYLAGVECSTKGVLTPGIPGEAEHSNETIAPFHAYIYLNRPFVGVYPVICRMELWIT